MKKRQEITDEVRRKNLFLETGIISGALLFFGAHWGVVYRKMGAEVPEGASLFLDSLNQALEHVAEHPFRLLPTEPVCVLISAFIALIVGVYLYSQYLRVKGTTIKAHGDAEFETRYELYDREFVYDPAIIAEGLSGWPDRSGHRGRSSRAFSVEKITFFNEEHKRVMKGRYLRAAARKKWSGHGDSPVVPRPLAQDAEDSPRVPRKGAGMPEASPGRAGGVPEVTQACARENSGEGTTGEETTEASPGRAGEVPEETQACARGNSGEETTEASQGRAGEVPEVTQACARGNSGEGRAREASQGRAGSVLDECRRRSLILTDRISLSMNGKWTQKNLSAIVFGGSGTGKSRFFLEPNILQGNSSIIVTDPSGDVLAATGDFLQKVAHYKIKVFNINNMTKSCRFNPLHYIRDEKDIPMIVNVLMENTQSKKSSGGDADFWDKTTRALLCAVIGYLYEVCPSEQRNFANVLELIRLDDLQKVTPDIPETTFDHMFRTLGEADPNSYAYKQYLTYKEAPMNTALSIQISTTVLLSQFFDIDAFKNLTYKDEMELDRTGEEATALFLQIPQADTTYSWITAMLFSLTMKELFAQGEARMAAEGLSAPELKVPVKLLIDEAANIGKIPDLQHYLATCRKYRMTIVPIFQNYSQVVTLYGKDTANDIVSHCDSFLFLGGVDADTLKIVVDRCGKESVWVLSQTMALSGRGGNSESKSQTGRDLVSRTQAEQLPNDTCLLFIHGLSPFKTKKYRLERHPNYQYMAEGGGIIFENPYLLIYEDEEIEGVRVKAASEEGYILPLVKDSARRRSMVKGMAMELEELRELRRKLYQEHETAEIEGKEGIIMRLAYKIQEVESKIKHLEGVPGVMEVKPDEMVVKKRKTGPLVKDFEIFEEGEALVGVEVKEIR